jgi:polyhydroxyalkanoate synthesis regulator phasin
VFQRITRRNLRKRLIVSTLSLAALASLLLGVTQVSAAHPIRGHQRGDCLRAAAGGLKLNNALDELVADGTITADQETAIVEQLNEGRLKRNFGCNGISILRNGEIGEAVTDLLGLDRFEIRQSWRDGQSLTEIAAAQGIDRSALVETILTSLDDRLDTAVERGTITAEQKDEILTNATPVIERAVDLHRGELREQMESNSSGSESPSTPASTDLDTVSA